MQLSPSGSHELGMTAGGGFFSEEARVGLDLTGIKRYWRAGGSSYIESRLFVEYTPSPFVKYAATATKANSEALGSYWEIEIRLAKSFRFGSNILEIEPRLRYATGANDAKRSGASVTVRNYFMKSSVYLRLGIGNYTNMGGVVGVDPSWLRISAGGDHLFGLWNGLCLLGLQYTYESGEPVVWFFEDQDRKGSTIRLNASIFVDEER